MSCCPICKEKQLGPGSIHKAPQCWLEILAALRRTAMGYTFWLPRQYLHKIAYWPILNLLPIFQQWFGAYCSLFRVSEPRILGRAGSSHSFIFLHCAQPGPRLRVPTFGHQWHQYLFIIIIIICWLLKGLDFGWFWMVCRYHGLCFSEDIEWLGQIGQTCGS